MPNAVILMDTNKLFCYETFPPSMLNIRRAAFVIVDEKVELEVKAQKKAVIAKVCGQVEAKRRARIKSHDVT